MLGFVQNVIHVFVVILILCGVYLLTTPKPIDKGDIKFFIGCWVAVPVITLLANTFIK